MTSPELDNAEPMSVQDPVLLLAGIKQFGLAGDGSDLRDLAAAITRLSSELATAKTAWLQSEKAFWDVVKDRDALKEELAASRERERALERERSQLAADIAGIQAAFAEERRDREAAEAEIKRLRAATIEECAIVVDAFMDSEAVSALAAVAESKGVKSTGWIKDAMHSHAGELAGKIASAIRALADANTQGGSENG